MWLFIARIVADPLIAVDVFPTHRGLNDGMKFGERGRIWNEYPAPNGRTYAAQMNADLIDRDLRALRIWHSYSVAPSLDQSILPPVWRALVGLLHSWYGYTIRPQAVIALVAEILILIKPTILNYVVGIYLILIGLLELGVFRF